MKLLFSILISLLLMAPVAFSQESNSDTEQSSNAGLDTKTKDKDDFERLQTDALSRVREYQRIQKIQRLSRRTKIYTDLVKSLKSESRGIDEVIRQRKLMILQDKIKEANEALNQLNK